MRIISQFRDYYDCIQSLGQSDVVYMRKKSIEHRDRDYEQRPLLGWPEFSVTAEGYHDFPTIGYVGVAGTFYRFVEIKESIFYTIEKLDEHADLIKNKHYFTPRRIGRTKRSPRNEFARILGQLPIKDDAPFIEYGAPLLLFGKATRPGNFRYPIYERGHTVTVNPCLKDMGFASVMEPYTIFQEIQMYLGSALAPPEKPIPSVSDIDMASIKGFDRHSFRKPKSKR